MNFWVTTDTHFGHGGPMEEIRPVGFEEKIGRGLSHIPASDGLIHLGDVSFGKDAEHHERFIRPLVCKKWLVLGNHDKHSIKWYLEHGWDFVAESFRWKMFGEDILFSHEQTCCAELGWTINIHGHYHLLQHRERPPCSYPDGSRHIFLSLERDGYRPFTLKTLLGKYEKGPLER